MHVRLYVLLRKSFIAAAAPSRHSHCRTPHNCPASPSSQHAKGGVCPQVKHSITADGVLYNIHVCRQYIQCHQTSSCKTLLTHNLPCTTHRPSAPGAAADAKQGLDNPPSPCSTTGLSTPCTFKSDSRVPTEHIALGDTCTHSYSLPPIGCICSQLQQHRTSQYAALHMHDHSRRAACHRRRAQQPQQRKQTA